MTRRKRTIKIISRALPHPLHRQIKDVLVGECRHRSLKEGTPVPSVRALCRRFKTSRVTIQKMLDELKVEGIVHSVPRSGVFWGRLKSLLFYRTVGVAFSVIGGPVSRSYSPYSYAILEGMHKVFLAQRYHVKALHYEDIRRPETLADAHCDGIIFTCARPERLPAVEYCRKIRLPYLLLDRPMPDESLNYLERDSRENIRDVTNYLLDSGHRKIGCIGGQPALWIQEKLYLGYRAAMEVKQAYDPDLILTASRSNGDEFPDVPDLLELCRRCTALLIMEPNPKWAEWVVTTLRRNHIRVPEDCSVVSLSTEDGLHVDDLTMTHFSITPQQMGIAAANGFIKLLEGKVLPPLHITFPTRIRHGKSVKEITLPQ